MSEQNLPSSETIEFNVRQTYLMALIAHIGSQPRLMYCFPLLVLSMGMQIWMVAVRLMHWSSLLFFIAPVLLIANVFYQTYWQYVTKDMKITISNECITVHTAKHAAQCPWSRVQSVRRALGDIFIETNNYPGENIWFPINAISSKEEAHRTIETIMERWRRGKSAAASVPHSHWKLRNVDSAVIVTIMTAAIQISLMLGAQIVALVVLFAALPFYVMARNRQDAFNRATKLSLLGNWSGALKALEPRLREPDYEYINAYLLGSACASNLMEHEKAWQYIERAKTIEPSNWRVGLAEIYRELRLKHAESALAKVDEVMITTPEELRYTVHCSKITALAALGRYDEAITYAHQVLPHCRNTTGVRIQLAMTYIAAHKYSEALECLQSIPEGLLGAEVIQVQVVSTLAFLGLDNTERAKAILNQAAAQAPSDPDVATLQSLMLAREGQWVNALEKADQAIKRNPYAADAYWVRKKIHEYKGDAAAAAADDAVLANFNFVSYLDPLLPPDKAAAPEV